MRLRVASFGNRPMPPAACQVIQRLHGSASSGKYGAAELLVGASVVLLPSSGTRQPPSGWLSQFVPPLPRIWKITSSASFAVVSGVESEPVAA